MCQDCIAEIAIETEQLHREVGVGGYLRIVVRCIDYAMWSADVQSPNGSIQLGKIKVDPRGLFVGTPKYINDSDDPRTISLPTVQAVAQELAFYAIGPIARDLKVTYDDDDALGEAAAEIAEAEVR